MMSKVTEKEAKPKKGKGLIVKLLGGLALLGAGGGGVFGLVQAGVFGGASEKKKEDNHPKLIRKGEEDPFAPKAEGDKEGAVPEGAEGSGGSEFRTSYFTFTDEMTSNLQNSDSFVQIGLAASTRRDGRVLIWLKKHELAVRSQLLIELGNTDEDDIRTPDGKLRLQKRMTNAINTVLTQREGCGGVDAVYFRSFLVQ